MYTLKFKTSEKNTFKLCLQYLQKFTNHSSFSTKKTKYFTSLVRSPHANKNSQEQFNLVYFNHIITIQKITTTNLIKPMKYFFLKNQNISGFICEKKHISFKSFF